MRTTLDLDPAVLHELKERRKVEGKPLGVIASELLALAFSAERARRPDFVWQSGSLELRIDLADKDALWKALEER